MLLHAFVLIIITKTKNKTAIKKPAYKGYLKMYKI